MPYFGSYISPEGARRLPHYKYKGSDDSLILNYITDPLYSKWVMYFPTWVAPNLITLTGLGFTICSHAILLYYCPKMENKEGEVPPWVHFFAAFSVLAYQAFDAMDGKQARRTGSGSPLGMLFDHGCDAINTTIICMNLCCALQTGPTLYAVQLWAMGGIGFFAQTLEEYYTGEMHLPMINAPNEGIFWSAAMHILAGCVTPQFWKTPQFLLGNQTPMITFVSAASLLGGLTLIYNIFMITSAIYMKQEAEREQEEQEQAENNKKKSKQQSGGTGSGRSRSKSKSRKGTSKIEVPDLPSPRIAKRHRVPVHGLAVAMSRFIPLLLVCCMLLFWMSHNRPFNLNQNESYQSNVYERHPRMFLWILGITQAKIATGTMLAHICEEEFHPNGRTTACATVLLFHICFCLVFNGKSIPYTKELTDTNLAVTVDQTMEELCLYELFLMLSLSYVHMATMIVTEVSSILKIHPFLITPRTKL